MAKKEKATPKTKPAPKGKIQESGEIAVAPSIAANGSPAEAASETAVEATPEEMAKYIGNVRDFLHEERDIVFVSYEDIEK